MIALFIYVNGSNGKHKPKRTYERRNLIRLKIFIIQGLPIFVCLFLTEEAWSHGGLRARELGQTPLVLVWLTNVSTSPDLYIEFSTEY